VLLQGQNKAGFNAGHMAVLQAAVFVGTRPEAIKLAPLILAMRQSPLCHVTVIASGQQPDLCRDALACCGVTSDFALFEAKCDQSRSSNKLTAAAIAYLSLSKPNLVIVQGDTTTALAAAKAAHAIGIAIAHVEAGLRTHIDNRPYPEEPNRIAIARLATLHFAPSQMAADNLRSECVDGTISVTGNTGIDAMCMMLDRESAPSLPPEILLTCHRRENFGDAVAEIARAAIALGQKGFRIALPLHSNPAVARPLQDMLSSEPNIALINPLPYPEMIAMVRAVRLVITDSGGLQEECAALGTPLILMREETERPEVVTSRNCVLTGSDRQRIVESAINCLTSPAIYHAMSQPYWPYGTGDASTKITGAVTKWWASQQAQTQSSLALHA
jgi:UDP-N-acetylglucosamine 2-epimerase (non-hydrolysing)